MRHAMLLLLMVWGFSFSTIGFSQTLPLDYIPQLTENWMRQGYTAFFQVGEVKGTVKNKGVYLPKPEYPQEAISADAEGEVRIQITIDDEGNVSSANAATGAQSLRAVCEDAARRTKFRIFRVDGSPVKTVGELVYQFDIKKAGWTQIGANLSGFFIRHYVSFVPIFKAFAPEWKDEREMLTQIAQRNRAEQTSIEKPTLQRTTLRTSNGTAMSAISGDVRLQNLRLLAPEDAVIFLRLVDSIRARLSKDELALWQFNLGLALRSGFNFRRIPNARMDAMDLIIGFIDRAPKGVSAATLADLRSLVAKIESSSGPGDGYRDIPRLVNAIINAN